MSAAAIAHPTTKAAEPMKFQRRRNGFTPLNHAKVMYELARLTGPKTQLLCVLFVLSETEGANRDKDTPPPSKSRPISSDEFAWFCHEPDVRTVERALKDLCDRKVLEREELKRRGFYAYSAPIATWSKLPDAESERKPPASADRLDSGEEEANSQRQYCRPIHASPKVPTKLTIPPDAEENEIVCNAEAEIRTAMDGKRFCLLIDFKGFKGEQEANSQRQNCRSKNGDADSEVLASLGKAVNGTRHFAQIEVIAMRDILKRWCQERIGSAPDDAVVELALGARGEASMEECARRLKKVTESRRDLTWPVVIEAIGGKSKSSASLVRLHDLLDDYFLVRHGKLPDDPLLLDIGSVLGEASFEHFRRLVLVRCRRSEAVPPPVFRSIAAEAAAAHNALKVKQATRDREAEKFDRKLSLDALVTALQAPDDPLAKEILDGADRELLEQARRML